MAAAGVVAAAAWAPRIVLWIDRPTPVQDWMSIGPLLLVILALARLPRASRASRIVQMSPRMPPWDFPRSAHLLACQSPAARMVFRSIQESCLFFTAV